VDRSGSNWVLTSPTRTSHEYRSVPMPCPYGEPGEKLWVRENGWERPSLSARDLRKGADTWPPYEYDAEPLMYWADGELKGYGWKRRPSIHMPRWASRIQVEVTEVRVQRLKEISEADAKAEGCERLNDDEPGYVERDEPDWKLCPQCGGTRLYTAYGPNGGACFGTDCTRCDTYSKRYRYLWESISGPGSWDANPWVWAVSFKRIET
jgi:hypothetical protein